MPPRLPGISAGNVLSTRRADRRLELAEKTQRQGLGLGLANLLVKAGLGSARTAGQFVDARTQRKQFKSQEKRLRKESSATDKRLREQSKERLKLESEGLDIDRQKEARLGAVSGSSSTLFDNIEAALAAGYADGLISLDEVLNRLEEARKKLLGGKTKTTPVTGGPLDLLPTREILPPIPVPTGLGSVGGQQSPLRSPPEGSLSALLGSIPAVEGTIEALPEASGLVGSIPVIQSIFGTSSLGPAGPELPSSPTRSLDDIILGSGALRQTLGGLSPPITSPSPLNQTIDAMRRLFGGNDQALPPQENLIPPEIPDINMIRRLQKIQEEQLPSAVLR